MDIELFLLTLISAAVGMIFVVLRDRLRQREYEHPHPCRQHAQTPSRILCGRKDGDGGDAGKPDAQRGGVAGTRRLSAMLRKGFAMICARKSK